MCFVHICRFRWGFLFSLFWDRWFLLIGWTVFCWYIDTDWLNCFLMISIGLDWLHCFLLIHCQGLAELCPDKVIYWQGLAGLFYHDVLAGIRWTFSSVYLQELAQPFPPDILAGIGLTVFSWYIGRDWLSCFIPIYWQGLAQLFLPDILAGIGWTFSSRYIGRDGLNCLLLLFWQGGKHSAFIGGGRGKVMGSSKQTLNRSQMHFKVFA